ncbi:MAG TPA: glycosyltransferase family 2 protein [Acidobacteriaceae bacterium]|nr:glycosyltransferase family 2 protein [Acidobacteriaceae bacterium]
MARVSIVVVTHQSAEFIAACLDSIAQIAESEVIVVDNDSSDSTCVKVSDRGVSLIANHENPGFAAAVNQGVRATSAPLILLLNPDARLETGLEPLLQCFNDEKTGGAGGLLVGQDGRPQTGFMARNLPTPTALIFEVLGINHFFPGNRVNWHYRCLGNDPMEAACIDQPAGAFFAFRRSAWEKLRGFDERFRPVWFEDVDFCARLRSEGYSVRYEPGARANHQGGHSVGKIAPGIREKYWYGSLLEYAAKHFHPIGFVAVCLSVIVGSAARAVAVFPRAGSRGFAVYGSVVRLAFARLLGTPIREIGQHG